MKIPDRLKNLMEYGVIEEVLRPLMSGKEARVYIVRARGEVCVAKVYKSATGRSFRQRAMYTEGRKTRNSWDQRAMNRRSKHGKSVDEEAWRSTEVEMIYRLKNAGVCVPRPICFESSVLVMEMVTGLDGGPAPRLAEVNLSVDQARTIYSDLIQQVIRMLSVGVVHGDLSDFNILLGVNTAEKIKLTLGSAYPAIEEAGMEVRGRELLAGVPRAVAISSVEVRDVLREPIEQILDAVHSTVQRLGPELAGDLLASGVTLCGGGALLPGLAEFFSERTGFPVWVADDPMNTVARGLGVFLEYFDDFVPILESAEDDL